MPHCQPSGYPLQAIKAHQRLAELEISHGGNPETHSFAATHPATLKRVADLQVSAFSNKMLELFA